MGELIELSDQKRKYEAAIERKFPVPMFTEFSFEFKRCLLKGLSLAEHGMSPEDAAVKSGFERVWVKEGHGRARPKKRKEIM